MKNSILSISLLALLASLSTGANASDCEKATEAKETTVDKATAQKKYSHVEEKTGIPQKEPEVTDSKTNAAPGRGKRYHSRDGK